MTSLVLGMLIGAFLTHFIPRLRKKSHNISGADVYERPDFNQISNSVEVEDSEKDHYTELQIRDEQERKMSEDVSPYEL